MFTKDVFIQKFFELSSEEKQIRSEANEYINQFQKTREAWSVARELIFTFQNQQDFQFIGASILQKKIKSEFSTLSELEQLELRSFIFQTLNDTSIIFSSQTSKQLCICAAIMGLLQLCTVWQDMIEDLIQFMKLSQKNIIYGLDILESIASEMSMNQIMQDRKFYLRTKSRLHEKQEQVYNIFNSLIQINNDVITKSCLNTIHSWTDVNIKLQILNNNELIQNCLILIDQDQYNLKISQILQESISQSNFADILQTSQHIKQISECEIKNIKLILEKLFSKTQLLLTGSFEYCKNYAELVKEIAVKFPIFILEKSEHSFALLKLLLLCSSHVNRKISVITFDFWKSFKQNLKDFYNEDIRSQEIDCLLEPYLELLKLFLEKCRYNKLIIKKKQQNYQLILKKQQPQINETEENLDNFEGFSDDDDETNMSIGDYRNYAQDVISEIYQTFTQFRGSLGQDLFFNIVFQLMNRQNFDNQQLFHCSIDVAFFVIRSIMDLIIIDKQSNIYINKIINFILSDELPFQPVLLITAMQILYDGVQEIKISQELQTPTIKLLLGLVHDQDLCRLATTTLKEIIEVKGITVQNFQFLQDEFAKEFQTITDENCLDSLIQTVFQCSIQLEHQESQQRALNELLIIIETRVTLLIQTKENNFKQILCLFISLMNGFLQIQEDSKQLVTQLSSQFIQKYMNYLNQIFSDYGPINQEMMLKFLKLFKLIIKTCDDSLPQNFILFFETSLKILQLDPIKNVQALSIFQTLLESLGNENQIFLKWMNENFIAFNNYMLVIFENPQLMDPDLIRYYILILCKTLQFNSYIFFQCPNYESIMNFVLKSFLTINEFEMAKQILRFFHAFIKYPNDQVLKCLPYLLNGIIIRITDINKSLNHNCALIFIDLCLLFKDQGNYITQIIIDSLKDKKYDKLNINQKKILSEAIIHYSCQNNLKDLKLLIGDFCNLINGTLTQNDMFFQLEIKISGEKRARKNGISIQNIQ